ncbi:MAG: hypothetical protein KVP17_004618 [Porospora cf. gigantea B]|uniref:uncharacterized protein n=1 Tax=Porospora cf. gigantea B TaxID=2853592 RepID=UPI003571B672|nr:MAG: hypothetical protein KVP17_004618 [Porospora cf. gigantea B]
MEGLLSKATQLARDVTDSVKESANRHTAVVSRAPASRWASYSVQTPRLLDLRALYSCERCAETGASHFKLVSVNGNPDQPACAELTGAGLRKCLPAWLCTHHPYLIRCKVSVERIECWVDCDEKDVLPVLDGRLVVKLVPVPYDIGLKSCVGVGWETEWTSMSHLFMPQTGHLSPPPVQLAPTPQVAPQETAPPVEHVSADERARLAVGDHQRESCSLPSFRTEEPRA